MFNHLGIVFRDLRVASAFYRAVLEPLGIKMMEDHAGADGTGWLVFSTGAPESPFFVVAARGDSASPSSVTLSVFSQRPACIGFLHAPSAQAEAARQLTEAAISCEPRIGVLLSHSRAG